MTTKQLLVGAMLAAAVAAAFAAHPVYNSFSDEPPLVECRGLNLCKAQGTYKSSKNSCRQQNACRGQGIDMRPAEDCQMLGGTIVREPTHPLPPQTVDY